MLAKWDRRYFVLPGGQSMLYYYKKESDAERRKAASGEIDLNGCMIERDLSAVPLGMESGGEGWAVQFMIVTDGRMLALRCDSGDTLRLWVAAIVAAGGEAEPNICSDQAPSLGGRLLMSSSGRIVGLDRMRSSGRLPNTPSGRFRALSLPDDFNTRETLDRAFGDDDEELSSFLVEARLVQLNRPSAISIESASERRTSDDMLRRTEEEPRNSVGEVVEEERKSLIDKIGEGLQGLFGGGSSKETTAAKERTVSDGDGGKLLKKRDTPAKLPVIAAKPMTGKRLSTIPGADGEEEEEEEWGEEEEVVAELAAGESAPKLAKNTKRDTPATLPTLPGSKKVDKRLSMIPGGEEEEEEEWGEEEEAVAELAAGESAPKLAKNTKRDTPATLPALPGSKKVDKRLSMIPGGEEEEEEEEENVVVSSSLSAVSELPSSASTAFAATAQTTSSAAQATAGITWPVTGWMHKQSGGKLTDKASVGNKLSKWDKRWFAIAQGSSELSYYKDPKDMAARKAPAGSVALAGSSLERIGGGDGTFALHTPERILTLRAESDAVMKGWVRAIVACGGVAEFEVTPVAPARPSLSKRASYAPGQDVSSRLAEGSLGVRPAPIRSVTFESPGQGAAAMPGMEGYLQKQVGRPGTAGVPVKWDRRYFVIPAGRTMLKYFRSRDDFMARKEAAGTIDVAGAVLQVERQTAANIVHIISGERTLALRADTAAILEHWLACLACPNRATDVTYTDPPAFGGYVTAAAGVAAAGRSRQGTASEGRALKVLLLGDANVGKTSVLTRFTDGLFVSSTRATVGTDLKKSAIDLDGDGVNLQPLQIWDTAGQEMFRSIISTYYRGAHGVMLMFDLTSAQSFKALPQWLEEVRSKAEQSAPIVLVGNKCDCDPAIRAVSRDAAVGWAKQHGMSYLECSAKSDVRINEVFVTLVAQAVGRSDEVDRLLGTARVTQAGKYGGVGGGGGKPADLTVTPINGRGQGGEKEVKGGCC